MRRVISVTPGYLAAAKDVRVVRKGASAEADAL
jgi:hypothetical protein